MDNDREVFPDHYTFAQRYGYEPLPAAMKLGELSANLRRELCNKVHLQIEDLSPFKSAIPLTDNQERLFQRTLGEFQGIPDHKVASAVPSVQATVDQILISEPCHRVLSFLEILLRHAMTPDLRSVRLGLSSEIQALLGKHSAAYRLVTDQKGTCWFHPCESDEHAKAIADAMETLNRGGFAGAKQHLRDAADHINGGRHGNAITDSIHAVESVARKIDPKANKTLAPALKSLRDDGLLTHEALRKAFEILYGYTSDEQGLRHARIDTDRDPVGVDESVFMFGACASFAGYLARKHLAKM